MSIQSHSETITFQTDDGVGIVGDYYPVSGRRAVLLVHMMPADRKSFAEFARKLQQAQSAALAIDLRGHGESTKMADGSVLRYSAFSDVEHQQSFHDVVSSISFLRKKGFETISLVGASIGANLALLALAKDVTLQCAVLLSPGLNYRGIEALPYIAKLHQNQKIWYIASHGDDGAVEMIDKMYAKTPDGVEKKISIMQKAGHGTDMFLENPSMMNEIINWLAYDYSASQS